ncbi:GGDEF domain-containing protein [Clostridium sp. WILCCON 0269]|uniref:GGDEF domain-containing protein n=1 Tax=Candidatus Clostridium eludens TaxID=3381663 RepID=A0ABW8SWX9_9CLOT
MKLKELIEFKIDGNESENFKKSIVGSNLYRGKLASKMLITFDLILCSIDVITYMLNVDDRFKFINYFIMYMLMIIVNVIFLVSINKYGNLDDKPSTYIDNWEKALMCYITFVISWGSAISLMDQKLYGHVIVFMVNMITCSVLYYLDSKKILIPYAISTSILVFLLPFFQKSKDVLIGHYVNLIIFLFISWLCSRILYYSYYSSFMNKTLLKKANDKLKRLNSIDELTQINNRRSFNDYISFEYNSNLKKDLLISVIMMDIDFFKQYNDNYGHNAGDKVLVSVAQEIDSVAAMYMNFAARFGGEEFIYVAIDTDEEQIMDIAQIIKTNITTLKIPHKCSQVSEYVSLSFGTSTVRITSKKDILYCMESADKALYYAKKSGRNCVKTLDNIKM